ncbi:MAG: glycosyltransferase family 9 protein [Blastocatellia bacterium]|nr:glycosyltransferase family 9 protein [Blastocatellia bacterium]
MPFSRHLKRSLEKSITLRSVYWSVVLNRVDRRAAEAPLLPRTDARQTIVFARLDSIGDFVLWTATFPALNSIYSRDRFRRILIANRIWASLANLTKFFDDVIEVDRRTFAMSPIYRGEIGRAVAELGADVFINPTLSRDFLWADSLARVSGADETIASTGVFNRMTPWQGRVANRWYTRLLDAPAEPTHELIANHRFVEQLTPAGSTFELEPPRLPLQRAPGERIVLFLGAQEAFRRWPVEHFAAVATDLASGGYEVIVAGGPGEEHLGKDFGRVYEGEFCDLTGKTRLTEFAELLAGASLLITNDTGAGHIAAAVNCPAVIINSGAQSDRFFPYPRELSAKGLKQIAVTFEMPCFGCDWNCVYKELGPDRVRPCIKQISPASVKQAARTLLQR